MKLLHKSQGVSNISRSDIFKNAMHKKINGKILGSIYFAPGDKLFRQ